MNKKRKIQEQIQTLERHLAAAEDYVARKANVRSVSAFHLGDWKGNSGHPLWMKNHMIPTTQRTLAEKERILDRIDSKTKAKQIKQQRRIT